MNQTNQGNISDAPPALPVKRKRGRPRKDQSLNHVETAPVPPGFEAMSRNQPHQADSVDDSNDPIVGQAVTGVVEAAFDAGYLLTVRIGNSNTNLRGVVFKPGHYVPVTAENDVAPNVQMIKRNEIHTLTENQMWLRGSNQGHGRASQTHDLVTSKGKYASPVAAPSVLPVGAGRTMVPVVLQPVNPSNGLSPASQLPSAASQGTHMTASRGKDVQTVAPIAAVLPMDGFTSMNQVLPASQLQITHQVTQKGVQNENAQGIPEVQHGEQAKSTKLTDITPSKVVQNVSESLETHSENRNMTVCKSSPEDCGVVSGQEIRDVKESVVIEPIQPTQSNLHNQSAAVSRSLENKSSGRMTVLLQALQENMTENHVPQAEP